MAEMSSTEDVVIFDLSGKNTTVFLVARKCADGVFRPFSRVNVPPYWGDYSGYEQHIFIQFVDHDTQTLHERYVWTYDSMIASDYIQDDADDVYDLSNYSVNYNFYGLSSEMMQIYLLPSDTQVHIYWLKRND
jgi:hypothetical protein